MTLPNFPQLDMFSAGINAPYGVLVAGQPSHNRGYTAAGLLIILAHERLVKNPGGFK